MVKDEDEKNGEEKNEKDDPWKHDDETPPEPKKNIITRLRSRFSRPKKKPPLSTQWSEPRWRRRRLTVHGLELFVAFVLFIIYLITSVSVASTRPEVLILFIPTMWIILAFIKLSQSRGEND